MTPEGWKTYRLEDLSERITSGGTPLTTKNEYYGGKIPWLKTQEINFNRIYNTETHITKEGLENSSAKWIDKNSIIVAMYGATAGKVALSKIPLTTNQACCNITLNAELADFSFIYYTLVSRYREILRMATGAAQQNLNSGMIKELEVIVPEKLEQYRIASILSSLDDKIELNLQMNKTLEAIAQAIFKEWFVDFRFPGFDGELVNGLPKGWRMEKVSDICKVNSNTLSYKDKINEIQYVEISEVERGIIKNITIYRRGEEPSRAKRRLFHGDVVLSTVRPNRGSYFLAYEPDDNLIASTGFAVFTAINVPYSFLYSFLSADEQIDYYGRMADGAAYPAINPSVIMNMNIVVPSQEILKLFDRNVEIILSKLQENLKENRILVKLRDNLLPKLMTGKIRVA